jgi:AcrR family transcriptional regulator
VATRRARTKPGLGKKEQAEQTRARVIDAAIALFSKHGFASTSTQDIARAIGMTPGVLYWHFRDKEAVLIAVLDELQRRLVVALAREGERTEGESAAETSRRFIARVARMVAESRETLLLVGVIGAEATDTNPRIERALREAYGRVAVVVRELLERAAAEGCAIDEDPECAAEMFLGLYMGAILHQRLFRSKLPLQRALPVIERMLFASLLPGEAHASAASRSSRTSTGSRRSSAGP